jgi:mRNA interferase RelE/StbE
LTNFSDRCGDGGKIALVHLPEPLAGYPLGGELTGYRKLVVGRNTWRIVYRITDDKTVEICEVWAVGARADAEVYTEAVTRVRDAVTRQPEFSPLTDVVERLGRLTGITVAKAPPREPVPGWLADRLIHTVGMPRAEVAALTLEQAVDRWAAFTARPREH